MHNEDCVNSFPVNKMLTYMIEGRRCYIVTDHRPLTFAFHQKPEKASPRRIRRLDFICQFTTDICHTQCLANAAADALSRINSIGQNFDYKSLATTQQTDSSFNNLVSMQKRAEIR